MGAMPSGPRGGSRGGGWSDQGSGRVRRVPRGQPTSRRPQPEQQYDPGDDQGAYGRGQGGEEPEFYDLPQAGQRYADEDWTGEHTWPGEHGRAGRPRSAIHDPWGEPRGLTMPTFSGALPVLPTIGVALLAVILAFVLGRVTAGGEAEVQTASATTLESTTTVSSAPIYHVVQENESLSAIAAQYGLTTDELAIANNIGDANTVFVGQRLVIPSPPPATTLPSTTKKQKN
jgi:LysM repeat protein